MSKDDICRTCKCWDILEVADGEKRIGRCRKNPPVINRPNNRAITGEWPTTYDFDWCDRYHWKGRGDNGKTS